MVVLFGPYLLPSNLMGDAYLIFHESVLPGLLEDVRQSMWFQHDGAPPHFTLAVRSHLDQRFEQKLIDRSGQIGWPARSPDLTTLAFFLWEHM